MLTNLLQSFGQTAGIGGLCIGAFMVITITILRKRNYTGESGKASFLLSRSALAFGGLIALAGLVVYIFESQKHDPQPKELSSTCLVHRVEGKLMEQTKCCLDLMQNVEVAIEINKIVSNNVFVVKGDFIIPDVSIEGSNVDATLWVSSSNRMLYKQSIRLPAPSGKSCKISLGTISLIKEQSLQKDSRYAEKRSQ